MDAFEQIVSKAFEARGYWTRIGFKANLTKATKRDLGNPSMPRPEIDVVAYKPSEKRVLLVECKSYLDSLGVQWKAFLNPESPTGKCYKLFNNKKLFHAVAKQIISQLKDDGMITSPDIQVTLCLVAGNIYGADETQIRKYFKDHKWMFIPPSELVNDLRRFENRGYENDVTTIVVKLLERNPSPSKGPSAKSGLAH